MLDNIGSTIKYYRELCSMTQEDLASVLGVAPQTIFKYEQGIVTNIPISKIILMAGAFGISPSVLLGWSDTCDNESITLHDVVSSIPLVMHLCDYCASHCIDSSDIISHYFLPEYSSCLTYLLSYGSLKLNDKLFYENFFHVSDFSLFLTNQIHYGPKNFPQYSRDEVNLIRKYRSVSDDTKNAVRAVLGLSPLESAKSKIG